MIPCPCRITERIELSGMHVREAGVDPFEAGFMHVVDGKFVHSEKC